MRLLLDGDIIAYTAAASAETPIDWGNGLWTLHAYEQEVEAKVEQQIASIVGDFEFDTVQVALSDKENFRKTICSEYKANRKSIRKPMLLEYAKDYLASTYGGLIYPTLEADDVLGIELTSDPETVIWSTDKDLKTVFGVHLIDNQLQVIDEEEADYWFLYQTLVGDLTDNYQGCPKVGPKTAEKILEKSCTWDAVVATFVKAGLSETVALKNARLARILRASDYKDGEVILWTPPDGNS
jgi:hypothetical protein